jgi:hypothetical protein
MPRHTRRSHAAGESHLATKSLGKTTFLAADDFMARMQMTAAQKAARLALGHAFAAGRSESAARAQCTLMQKAQQQAGMEYALEESAREANEASLACKKEAQVQLDHRKRAIAKARKNAAKKEANKMPHAMSRAEKEKAKAWCLAKAEGDVKDAALLKREQAVLKREVKADAADAALKALEAAELANGPAPGVRRSPRRSVPAVEVIGGDGGDESGDGGDDSNSDGLYDSESDVYATQRFDD